MSINIDLTTLLSSAITGVINGVAVFLAVRYMGKFVDRLEKDVLSKKIIKKNEKEPEEKQ